MSSYANKLKAKLKNKTIDVVQTKVATATKVPNKPYAILTQDRYSTPYKLNANGSYKCLKGALIAYLKDATMYHDRACTIVCYEYSKVEHLTKEEYDLRFK